MRILLFIIIFSGCSLLQAQNYELLGKDTVNKLDAEGRRQGDPEGGEALLVGGGGHGDGASCVRDG